MKRFLTRIALVAGLFSSLLSLSAHAQIQVGVGANFTNASSLENFNTEKNVWGGGITLRYFVTPHVAVGANARYFAKSTAMTFGPYSGTAKANLLDIAPQLEYFILTGSIRPYVGVEGGYYKINASYEGQPQNINRAESAVYAAPKAGIQVMLTPSIGLDVYGAYHYAFPKETATLVKKGGSPILGAGLVFELGRD